MERNIVIVSCANNFGGAERVLWEVNNSLSKKFNTKLILNKNQLQFYANSVSEIVYSTSGYYKLSQNIFGVAYYFLSSFFLYFKVKKLKYPVLYCNDFESLILVLFSKIFIPSTKVIWHIHDIYDFQKSKNKLIFKLINCYVDKYICLTSRNCERVKKIVGDNVYLLKNFSRFNCSTPKSINNKNRITLGYAGQITRWKGIHKIIEYVNLINLDCVPDIHLKIIGKPYYKNDFEYFNFLKKITSSNLNVIWSFYSENLVDFYQSIDFLINFSDNEPFGLVIVEAMSQGTPVIAFDGDGPAEIISKNYENGIIVSDKKSEVIKELTFFFNSLENIKYNSMSIAAIQTTHKFFTKKSFEANLLNLFKDFC